MKTATWIQIAAIGLSAVSNASAGDELTKAVTDELGKQCLDSAGYQTCVAALRYHGFDVEVAENGQRALAAVSGPPAPALIEALPRIEHWEHDAGAGTPARSRNVVRGAR